MNKVVVDKGILRVALNKCGVPYHRYFLRLANGVTNIIDIGYEEDWGNIQEFFPDDCADCKGAVGWGNDEDGHEKIIMVVDLNTYEYLNVQQWADYAWQFAEHYSR